MKHIPAKSGYYRGVFYASKMEIRMAKLLDKNNIRYTPHAILQVKENGKTREIDFLLKTSIKPYWASSWIYALEVKGWLEMRDWIRKKELEQIGIPTFIVMNSVLTFWEHEAFLEYPLYDGNHLKNGDKKNGRQMADTK